jgi:acyl carrier protein phosphodiesterase
MRDKENRTGLNFLLQEKEAPYAGEVNYLAHLHLSGNDRGLIIGNFIGDGIRGENLQSYPAEIRKGILLHRQIDHFTDSHKIVLQSKQRLRPRFHKFAPVIADVYYDHFLARNWTLYHEEDFRAFVDRMVLLLEETRDIFPERSRRFLHYAVETDLFYKYGTLEGMDHAFRGLARRTRFENKMEEATGELRKNSAAYESEFKKFFPDLVENVRSVV